MSDRASVHVRGTEPRRTAGLALALAAGGVAAAVGLWVLLASITGLIYHFLPGSTFLVATWIFRQVARGRQAAWLELAAVVTAGAAGTIVGIALVAGIGRELDTAPVTSLVAITGALIGAVWLRRGTTSKHHGHGSEKEHS